MSNGDATANALQAPPIKNLVDQSQTGVTEQVLSVCRDNTRGFLTTVLQGVQPEMGQVDRVLVPPDAEKTAIVLNRWIVHGNKRRKIETSRHKDGNAGGQCH